MQITITSEYEDEKRHFHSNRLQLFLLQKNNALRDNFLNF